MSRGRVRGAGLSFLGFAVLGYLGVQTLRGWWASNRDAMFQGLLERLVAPTSLLWMACAVTAVVALRVRAGHRPARGVDSAVTLVDLQPTPGVRNDGSQLETLTADLITRDGGSARRCGGSGDRGVDVAGQTSTGRPVVVQCKQYASDATIGPGPVRELVGAARLAGGDPVVLFVTTAGGFSAQAIAEARQAGVGLVALPRLAQWMDGTRLAELGIARPPIADRLRTSAGYARQVMDRLSGGRR